MTETTESGLRFKRSVRKVPSAGEGENILTKHNYLYNIYHMGNIRKRDVSNIAFEVKSKLGVVVKTTRGYWNIIIQVKHPSVKGKEKNVKDTLSLPDEIRVSKRDKDVYLFYKKYRNKFLCVVSRIHRKSGYIITSYYTEKIKEGELKWKK